MRVIRGTVAACLLPLSAFAVGCGGGERQDANEPSGSFPVQITKASFPAKQSLAQSSELKITVRNPGTRPLPDVAVTVDSFSSSSDQAGLADAQRPVWIVDEGPVGGETAFVNTWALGKLPAGASKTFTWKVTAIQAGARRVSYRVSPGVDGKARAADPARVSGTFNVNISKKPAQSSVDPETGAVVRDTK